MLGKSLSATGSRNSIKGTMTNTSMGTRRNTSAAVRVSCFRSRRDSCLPRRSLSVRPEAMRTSAASSLVPAWLLERCTRT